MQYPPFDNGNAILRSGTHSLNGLHRIIVDFLIFVCLSSCSSKLEYASIHNSHLYQCDSFLFNLCWCFLPFSVLLNHLLPILWYSQKSMNMLRSLCAFSTHLLPSDRLQILLSNLFIFFRSDYMIIIASKTLSSLCDKLIAAKYDVLIMLRRLLSIIAGMGNLFWLKSYWTLI